MESVVQHHTNRTEDSASSYLLNAWYVAALAQEVGPTELFHRTLLDTSILLYRKVDGTAVAIHNRCPHRFAPLHLGTRNGDEVACKYHGLVFDCTGQCTHSPHGNGNIPKAAKVRAYPIIERYGFLWIWMGDKPADESLLPDFSYLDQGPDTALAYTYLHVKCYYELVSDNVMDLSHVDHLHSEIISTKGTLSPLMAKVREEDRSVNARWEWTQTPASLLFSPHLPDPEGETRLFFDITWTPPGNIQLSVGALQGEGNLDLNNTVGQYDLHTVTPETAKTTHYFFATRRNHLIDDAEHNEHMIQILHDTFQNEDGAMLEAVQEEMQTTDFFALNPVLMSNDVAPVRVRRLLRRLVQEERG